VFYGHQRLSCAILYKLAESTRDRTHNGNRRRHMNEPARIAVLLVAESGHETLENLQAYCGAMPHLSWDNRDRLPGDLSPWDVVLTCAESPGAVECDRLSRFARAGSGWLHVLPAGAAQAPGLFGVEPRPAGPACEWRVYFDRAGHPLSARLPDAIYVRQPFRAMDMKTSALEIILCADWHYEKSSVLVARRVGDGTAACTTLQDFKQPVMCQIFYRLIRQLGGVSMAERDVGVGILGYAPWVGPYHGQGVASTSGLTLQAVCDTNPERIGQAQADFPGVAGCDTSDALGGDPGVDLVIIATPPNTHARLALQMMQAGKHVVCEKPLALNRGQTAAMAEAAQRQGVLLSCHQNRRWDVDYLAIKQALAEGLIGDLFHAETFVGGFSHPCGYWHSHAPVSGGTAYDWGGHYIDWLVSLFKGPVEAVIGSRHKRVWHDISNADQERIQIRFTGGREAEFIHSDIAAARKPKWYLLGTQGAIVGRWQEISAYESDPLHYFQRHDIPATEMPPDLTVYQAHTSGKTTALKPAVPDRPVFGFHRNLADHLLTGEPLVAPLDDSIRVVAVLEAAARSMANGGRMEALHV
jgi:predicted dehydrogenase